MDASLVTSIASLGVAVVTAVGGYLSIKASGKSTREDTGSTLEAKRLEQGYERARKFDIQTIESQDRKIKAQDVKIETLEGEVNDRDAQIFALRNRVAILETRLGITPPIEGAPT